jgi:hypothetical protein
MVTRLVGFTFAQIPMWLLACTDLDPQAKVVYGYLTFRQGTNPDCWPSVARIATDLNLNRATVLRHLESMERLGCLRVERTAGRVNHYTIVADPPQQLTLGPQMAAELHLTAAPTPSGEPVASTQPVGEQPDTSRIHATGSPDQPPTSSAGATTPVASTPLDQSHPCDTNDIKERFPRTIEKDGALEIWQETLRSFEGQVGLDLVNRLVAHTSPARTDNSWLITVDRANLKEILEARWAHPLARELSERTLTDVSLAFRLINQAGGA